jgi:hypothetical protein
MTTELVEPDQQLPNNQVNYDNMVVNNIAITGNDINKTEATILYVSLKFWFNKNPGCALPPAAMPFITFKRNELPKSKT